MSSPYENSFHKIVRADDLALDRLQVYRAAGTTVVLRRVADGITAIDGSSFVDHGEPDPHARLQQMIESAGGHESGDWSTLVAQSGLAVKVEDGDVWVCIEGCES